MNYPEFKKNNNSLLRKHLTRKIFNQLKMRKTKTGFTLFDAMQSGMVNQDSAVGIYAGCADAYQIFSGIFNPVTADYHSFDPAFNLENVHRSDLSPVLDLKDPDPEGRYIISTRIRAARNIEGFDFTPFINAQARKEVELRAVKALNLMGLQNKNLKGRYIPLQKIDKSEQIYFSKKHVMFNGEDRFQNAAGINRDWPESRGIFISDDEKIIVWVNEEDHLRIISMVNGGKTTEAFNRLCIALSVLKENISFSFDNYLGYLTSCPSNLGTGMRAGVHIKLPGLYKNKDLLFKIAKVFNLQIRGTGGEKTRVERAVFDISNRQRLGITEKKCIQSLNEGIIAIIAMEKEFE